MKVEITPETEAEKAETQVTTYVGLTSVAVIGLAYEGEALRHPHRYSFGDLEDLMREFFPMAFDMWFETQRAKKVPWEGVHVHGEMTPPEIKKSAMYRKSLSHVNHPVNKE